jgi:hypothetical protein
MKDKELTETLLGKQLPSVDFEDMITLLGIVATCWYTAYDYCEPTITNFGKQCLVLFYLK